MAEEEESDTNSTIMTISELIENAFGDPEVNVVHHKHLQAVLYIIARQLRILERRVAVNLKPYQVKPPAATLSVTEVKLQALSDMNQKVLGKSAPTTGAQRTKDSKEKGKKIKTSGGYPEKSTSVSDETSTDKELSGKKSGKKAAFDDTPTAGTTSAARKKTPHDYISDDDTASSAGKSSRTPAKSSADKSSTADEISSTGPKSIASTKSTTGKKTNASKSSAADKTSPADETSDDDTSSAYKSSKTEKTTVSRKSTDGKSSVAGQKSSEDDISDITASTADKTGTKTTTGRARTADEISSSDKKSSVDTKTTAGKKTHASESGKTSPTDEISDDASASAAGRTTKGEEKSATSKKTARKSSTAGKSVSENDTLDGDVPSVDKISRTDKKTVASDKSTSGKSSTADKSAPEDDVSDTDAAPTTDRTSRSGKETTSGTTKETTSGTAKETTSGTAKETTSGTAKETTSGTAKETSSGTAKETTSGTDKETTSGKKEAAGKKATSGKSAPEDDSDVVTDPAGKTKKKSAREDDSDVVTDPAGKTKKKSARADDSDVVTDSAQKSSEREKKATATKIPSDAKTSSEDRLSLSRTLSDKKLAVDKSGKKLSTQGDKASGKATSKPADNYLRLLDEVEETRERELRVIHQRADSREERETIPTPLASMDSLEATYEKLLVVERVSPEEAKARAAAEKSTIREMTAPRLSVVTQNQFQELVSAVRQIQKKFAPVGAADFPENLQLMEELRKGASLTDAMAALQLSARLEATEKGLTNMLSLVTDLAKQTPGFQPTKGGTGGADKIEVLFGATDGAGQQGKGGQKAAKSSSGKSHKDKDEDDFGILPSYSEAVTPVGPPVSSAGVPVDEVKNIEDLITIDQLEMALENVHDNIMALVTDKTKNCSNSADAVMKLLTGLENKIDSSVNLGNKMENLEQLITNYADQINYLDTGFTSQLTNFQDELTQMQHNLEIGLETMAEVLANAGGDATAVSELNEHFNDLQVDISDAMQRQKELKSIQSTLNMDLDGLRIQIEMLRDAKSDRDEVADALRDKAGLRDLNGLISQDQFDAVCGDIEKRIAAAYDKFNNQESIWQRAIDELIRELNEKADIIQVESLRDEINRYLEDHRKKLKFITDIVGEPSAAALLKHLNRDSACLSCSTPAHMKATEDTTPLLPAMRPPTIGAEAKQTEDHDRGDNGLCYQGYPVKHPIDPRAHICKRWCGGSHTLINNSQKTRIPPSVTITSLNRNVGQERGTDGKMYAVDEQVPKKPCTQCIIPNPPATSNNEIRLQDPPSFDYQPMMGIQDYDVTCSDNLPLPSDIPPPSLTSPTTDYDVTPPL